MRVWQVGAVVWLVTFIGACDRSPDHTTTSAAAAACCKCDRTTCCFSCAILLYQVDSSCCIGKAARLCDSRRQRRGPPSAVRTYEYLLFAVDGTGLHMSTTPTTHVLLRAVHISCS